MIITKKNLIEAINNTKAEFFDVENKIASPEKNFDLRMHLGPIFPEIPYYKKVINKKGVMKMTIQFKL